MVEGRLTSVDVQPRPELFAELCYGGQVTGEAARVHLAQPDDDNCPTAMALLFLELLLERFQVEGKFIL